MPTVPVAAAGRRTEPVVSDPSANIDVPAMTEAPHPELDPPVNNSVFQGLRAGGKGKSKYSPPLPVPYSQEDSRPMQIAPCSRNCAKRRAPWSGTQIGRASCGERVLQYV